MNKRLYNKLKAKRDPHEIYYYIQRALYNNNQAEADELWQLGHELFYPDVPVTEAKD